MEDRNPMEGDEIRAFMMGEDLDEIEIPKNPMLDELLEAYDCSDLLPFASRILWLSSIKEVLGYIPDYIPIDYEELRCLVILQEERGKKIAHDSYRMKEDSKRQSSTSLQSAASITRYKR